MKLERREYEPGQQIPDLQTISSNTISALQASKEVRQFKCERLEKALPT